MTSEQTNLPDGAPDLRTLIGDYLVTRRALGFKLNDSNGDGLRVVMAQTGYRR